MSLLFQILSDSSTQSTEPYTLETVKIGVPIKKAAEKPKPEEKKEGDIELSSDRAEEIYVLPFIHSRLNMRVYCWNTKKTIVQQRILNLVSIRFYF